MALLYRYYPLTLENTLAHFWLLLLQLFLFLLRHKSLRNNRQNQDRGSSQNGVNIRFTQDCQKLDELGDWKLVSKFLYLPCSDWHRIKFDVNIVWFRIAFRATVSLWATLLVSLIEQQNSLGFTRNTKPHLNVLWVTHLKT